MDLRRSLPTGERGTAPENQITGSELLSAHHSYMRRHYPRISRAQIASRFYDFRPGKARVPKFLEEGHAVPGPTDSTKPVRLVARNRRFSQNELGGIKHAARTQHPRQLAEGVFTKRIQVEKSVHQRHIHTPIQ